MEDLGPPQIEGINTGDYLSPNCDFLNTNTVIFCYLPVITVLQKYDDSSQT